jgi:two-component system nitrogen regulation response regulator NtrX
MQNLNILIVDDEKNIRRSMEIILASEGYTVHTAQNAAEASKLIESKQPDLVFLDVLLPDESGLDLLPKIKKAHPQIEVIMISGHANLSMAVQATKTGAYDFMEKPLQKDRILLAIKHLLEKRELQQQFQKLREEKFDDYRMVGESPAIEKIREQISLVAPTNSKVLILGESGTGKELIAWAIHQDSSRKSESFVKMNCAAIPEELTESELFGSEKGAFTGATETRDGKFLQADKGTLLLDEIADMSLKVQTKVLRVLQDGQFERIGGKSTLTVDVRVIAATNRNLDEMVKQGNFREDLYYRLNVFPISAPLLRERKDDIALLLQYFIKKYCFENNRRLAELSNDAKDILKNYPWPGNIRELKNLVERLLIMNPGEKITASDLPSHLTQPDLNIPSIKSGSNTLKEVRDSAEREYIMQTLKLCNGNVSKAARMLGLERTNLHKKMNSLGIKRSDY